MASKDDTIFGTSGFGEAPTAGADSIFGTGGFVEPKPKPRTERTWGEAAGDIGAEIMQGGVGVVDAGQGLLNWATGRTGKDKFDADFITSAKEYWDDKKSDIIKAKEVGLSEAIQNPDQSVAGYLWDNPEMVGQLIAGSTLPMLASGGLAGAGAKAAIGSGLLKAGSKATPYVLAGISGASEGALMAGDVYNETESGLAAAGALGLGIATGGIGGNVGLGIARRAVGKEILGEGVENAFNKTVARRVLTSIAGEGAQEYIQEGGQSLIEMMGNGEEIDLMQAAKRATVGAIVGAAAGGGFHPMFGDTKPEFKTVAERDAALQLAENQRWQEYLVTKGASNSPGSIVEFEEKASDPAFLRRNSEVAYLAQQAANAEAVLTKNPNDPLAKEGVDSARAALTAAMSTPQERQHAAAVAAQGGAAATISAPTVEAAIQQHVAGQEASSTLRTGAAAVESVKQTATSAVKQGATAQAAAAATIPAAQTTIEPSEEVVVPPAAATTAPAPSAEPKLPPELSKAAPRYSFGSKQFTLEFPNDVMRAAYIVANSTTKSKADPKFLAFVRQQTGMSEAEAALYGNEVKAAIKKQAKVSPAGNLKLPTIPYVSLAALGATPKPKSPKTTKAPVVKHATEIRDALAKADAPYRINLDLRSLLNADLSRGLSDNKLIHAARQLNYPDRGGLPTPLAEQGITQQQWDEYRASMKEAVGYTRTGGVAEQINKGTTVGGMLDYLAGNATPRVAKMAAQLKKLAAGNPYLRKTYKHRPKEALVRGSVGYVSQGENRGRITRVENVEGYADEITSLHEPVHALTKTWLARAKSDDRLKNELGGMLNAARLYAKRNGETYYGLKDEAEFLAEAFANPQFQDFLMGVPATKDQSLWDKLVSWVRDVIGEPDMDLQLLGQVMQAGSDVIKRSTKAAQKIEAKSPSPDLIPTEAQSKDTGDDMADIASRDTLENLVDNLFEEQPDLVTKLIDINDKLGGLTLEQLRNARATGLVRDFVDGYIARYEAGFDDAFDVINNRIDDNERQGAKEEMMGALGIEEEPDYGPDQGGFEGIEDFQEMSGVAAPEERALHAALDELWNAGGNNVATIQRTMNQSPTELRLVARSAGNGARSAMAQAMLDYPNIEGARVAAGARFSELVNENATPAAADDRMTKQSDPEPARAEGGRKITYDFKQRLANAYASGALKKLGAFWQNVMSNDGQIKIDIDGSKFLNGQDSTPADYKKLVDAYNAAMFEKAKQWAKKRNHPEPKDMPNNEVIGFLKPDTVDGKPVLRLSVRGLGREHAGENPYLPNTVERTSAYMDFNPHSKQNEIHAMDLAGYTGTADVVYRVFSDVAKAHKLRLPTSDTLMSNNNVRRPWQTVATSLRLQEPDLLSPMVGGRDISSYGMDTKLWAHLTDQERIGANILRHTHNALVSRPDNAARYAKQVISNGRALDNLVVSPDGKGFIAKYEPNTPNGMPKGSKLDYETFVGLLKKVNAIGGESQADPQSGRKGLGPTSAAFAIMSQTVLDEIENNSYADPAEQQVVAAAKMGKEQEGWFFDRTEEQKSQLQSEIDAVREFLNDPNTSPQERAEAREVLRQLTASDIDLNINDLIAEHRAPQTSNGRRGEINREIAALRMEQTAKRDTMLENIGLTPETKYDLEQMGKLGVTPIRITGEHYSHQQRTELDPSKYGTGYKGAERKRIERSDDERLKTRVHFYADAGNGIRPESGVGAVKHVANLDGIYPAHESNEIQKTIPNTLSGDDWHNAFESAVLDAGYKGYSAPFGNQLAVTVFGTEPIPVLTNEAAKVVGQKNPLADNPELALVNIGLDVGAGARTQKINPSTARMVLEQAGVKITRSNVVESTYEKDGKKITERTLVAELDRPLTQTEAEKVAALTQQEAIAQRSADGNMLYGPKAQEWGGFDATQFALLDGSKLDPGEPQMSLFDRSEGPLAPPVDAAVQGAQAGVVGSPNEIRVVDPRGLSWFERITSAVRTAIQDKHVTLGRIMRAIKDNTVLSAIDRFQGIRQFNYENLVVDPMAKLENTLFKAGITRAEFDKFLINRAVPDRNAHIARVNPYVAETNRGFNLTDKPGTGIKTEDALTYLASLDKAKYQEAAAIYDSVTRSLQQYAVAAGLETQDTIDAWNNLFPTYAPLHRELDIEDIGSGTGFGFSVREGIARRAMGSAAPIQSPLANTLLQGARIVDRGEKARVGQTLFNLATRNNAPVPMFQTKGGEWKPMWQVDTSPNIRTVKQVNVYQVKDINGQPILNGGGVPIEFYSEAKAAAYIAATANNPNGAKSYTSLGVQGRVVTSQNPAYINKDNVLIIPVDGENRVIIFNEDSTDAMAMVRNLKNLDTAQLSGVFKVTNVFSRWVVGTSTQYNPMFAPINFLRDIQSSAINMASTGVPNWTAADSAMLMGNAWKNSRSILRHLNAKHNAKHSNTLAADVVAQPGTPEWWMEKAKAAGGLTGLRESMSNFEDAMRQVNNLFGDAHNETDDPRIRKDALYKAGERLVAIQDKTAQFLEGDVKNKVAKLASRLPVMVDHLNSAFEMGTRVAAFKASYEKYIAAGLSDKEATAKAAVVSKNVSVNFNRKGNISSQLGALFPFFNAAVQGSARLAELLFEKKGVYDAEKGYSERTGLTKAGKVVLGALPALGALQGLLLAAAGYEDDQPPEHVKARNFVIPTGGGDYVTIPMPLGLNAVFNMGRHGVEAMLHPQNAWQHAADAIMDIPSAFNPLGGTPNLLLNMTPAAGDIPVALLQNRDAFDRPIYKEDRDPRRPTPGWTRSKDTTSGFGTTVAKTLNNLTGGSEYRPGLINWTGDQIDYVFGQLGGGVARETGKLIQYGSSPAPDENRPWYKVPLLGKFAGSTTDTSAVRNQLYGISAELNTLNAEVEGLREDRKVAEARQVIAEHPELRMRPKVEAYFNSEGKLRKAREAAKRDGDKEKADQIDTQIREKSAKLLAEINAIKEGRR